MQAITNYLRHDVRLFSMVTDNLANTFSIEIATSGEIRTLYDILAKVYLGAIQDKCIYPINFDAFFSLYPTLEEDKRNSLEKEIERLGGGFKLYRKCYLGNESIENIIAYLETKLDL